MGAATSAARVPWGSLPLACCPFPPTHLPASASSQRRRRMVGWMTNGMFLQCCSQTPCHSRAGGEGGLSGRCRAGRLPGSAHLARPPARRLGCRAACAATHHQLDISMLQQGLGACLDGQAGGVVFAQRSGSQHSGCWPGLAAGWGAALHPPPNSPEACKHSTHIICC